MHSDPDVKFCRKQKRKSELSWMSTLHANFHSCTNIWLNSYNTAGSTFIFNEKKISLKGCENRHWKFKVCFSWTLARTQGSHITHVSLVCFFVCCFFVCVLLLLFIVCILLLVTVMAMFLEWKLQKRDRRGCYKIYISLPAPHPAYYQFHNSWYQSSDNLLRNIMCSTS